MDLKQLVIFPKHAWQSVWISRAYMINTGRKNKKPTAPQTGSQGLLGRIFLHNVSKVVYGSDNEHQAETRWTAVWFHRGTPKHSGEPQTAHTGVSIRQRQIYSLNPAKKKKKYPQVRKNARVERLWGCFQLKQIAAAEAKLRGKQNKNWNKVASEPECWHWCRGCERLLARAVSGGSFIPPCGGDGVSMGADAATIGGNKRFTPSTSSLQPWVIAPREPAPLPRCQQGYEHWEGGITDWEGSYALAAELTHPFPIRRNISHKYLMYKNWPWDLFFFFCKCNEVWCACLYCREPWQ